MEQAGSTTQRVLEPEGRYADRFKIGYRSSVFVLDFDQSFYEDEKERAHTRIITTPEYAKALSELLQESIGQYEENYGRISKKAETNPSLLGDKKIRSGF